MRVEILGSGGALSTPRALCGCDLCRQARQQGVPYSRSGPSLFVHGPDLIVDTPEDIIASLARSRVERIAVGTYSHWHPDHLLGARMWESLNGDYTGWPPTHRKTPLYFPRRVAEDVRDRLGIWETFTFLEQRGLIEIIELAEEANFFSNEYQITPVSLAEEYVFAQIVEGHGKRLFVAVDELFGWCPSEELGHFDLAVLPLGMTEFKPLSGQRHYPLDHPVLRRESTLEQTLDVARALNADRIVLTHISEADQLGYDDGLVLEERWRQDGLPITMAYDGLLLDV